MFLAWDAPQFRATRDIDLLGRTSNSLENLISMCQKIIEIPVQDDGLIFLPDTIATEIIQEHKDYHGVRLTFFAKLENARIPLQLDIGFDDVIYPEPIKINYPTILDSPEPGIWGYTPESMVAEKFHTLVNRDVANSRFKDYFDLWYLSNQFKFDLKELNRGLHKTFNQRRTELTADLSVFSEDYFNHADHQKTWVRFLSRNKITIAPDDFGVVMRRISEFIKPAAVMSSSISRELSWMPEQGWV